MFWFCNIKRDKTSINCNDCTLKINDPHPSFCHFAPLKPITTNYHDRAVIIHDANSICLRDFHSNHVFQVSETDEVGLSIVTYIGLGVSIVSLFIALTIFWCVRQVLIVYALYCVKCFTFYPLNFLNTCGNILRH